MVHVVVVGRSGQVATELRRQPLPAGWTLSSLGRPEIDLAQPECAAAVIARREPDILVNAAAYTAVDRAEEEEELATLVNGRAPGVLAGLAAELGIPLLHVSTDFVFDGASAQPWPEDSAPGPINAYGRSKLAGERAIAERWSKATVLRTSWVFSPFGSNFVKTMVRLADGRSEVRVVADQRGGPTSADDIAGALMRMAQALVASPDPQQFGVFHYCGQPETSWADFAQAIFEAAAWIRPGPVVRPISSAQYGSGTARPQNSVLDCSRIARVFKIAQPDWRQGLRRTLAELQPAGCGA